jgi:hypothetical protein
MKDLEYEFNSEKNISDYTEQSPPLGHDVAQQTNIFLASLPS